MICNFHKILSIVTISTLLLNCSQFITLETNASLNSNYTFNDHVILADHEEDIMVYYPSNIASQYGERIMSGAFAWYSSHTDHCFHPVRSYYLSDRNVFAYTFYRDANADGSMVLAQTEFYTVISYDQRQQISPYNSDWDECDVKINTNSAADVTFATMRHEFGHVYGLAHRNNDPTSIMCQAAYGRTATNPSLYDYELLMSLYE